MDYANPPRAGGASGPGRQAPGCRSTTLVIWQTNRMSPLYELVRTKLSRDPAEWLNEQHDTKRLPWDEIAHQLRAITGRRITAQTLREWAKGGTG